MSKITAAELDTARAVKLEAERATARMRDKFVASLRLDPAPAPMFWLGDFFGKYGRSKP